MPIEPNPASREISRSFSKDAQAQFERELDQASVEIQALRVQQQRFLAGDLARPPKGRALRLQAKLRGLRVRARGVGSQYRLNTLEARLQSHLDLFHRRLEARERSAVEPAEPVSPELDPEKGVVIGTGDDADAEVALYRHLTRDPRAAKQLDPGRFRAMLSRHVDTIRAKTGCQEVEFRVVLEEDGKPKLKAKPVKTP